MPGYTHFICYRPILPYLPAFNHVGGFFNASNGIPGEWPAWRNEEFAMFDDLFACHLRIVSLALPPPNRANYLHGTNGVHTVCPAIPRLMNMHDKL